MEGRNLSPGVSMKCLYGARRWLFMAAIGTLMYSVVYWQGRRCGAFVFIPTSSHPDGATLFIPPPVDGEAWRMIAQYDPDGLLLSDNHGSTWVGLAFGLAGWIELEVCPKWALADLEVEYDSTKLATFRVYVGGADGVGEVRILRNGTSFKRITTEPGEWSAVVDVPAEENMHLVWLRNGIEEDLGLLWIPKGRHVDRIL